MESVGDGDGENKVSGRGIGRTRGKGKNLLVLLRKIVGRKVTVVDIRVLWATA